MEFGGIYLSPREESDEEKGCRFSVYSFVLLMFMALSCCYSYYVIRVINGNQKQFLVQDVYKPVEKQSVYQSIFLPIVEPINSSNQKYLLVLCSTLFSTMMTEDIEVFFKVNAMLEDKYNFRMVVFSESTLIQKKGKEFGIRVVPYVKTNDYKKPVFPFLMQTTEKLVDSSFYGYINGDVILSESVFPFLETILSNQHNHHLLQKGCMFAGRMSEVKNLADIDLSSHKSSFDFDSVYKKGSLRGSSDFFIYSGSLYSTKPDLYDDVVVGRYYIDNWIMGSILLNNGYLVDATRAIHGIHMGTDSYLKKSFRQMISLKDYYYNRRITRPGYPWASLVYSNYTAYWNKSFLVLDVNEKTVLCICFKQERLH